MLMLRPLRVAMIATALLLGGCTLFGIGINTPAKKAKPEPKPCTTLPLSLHLKVGKLVNLDSAGQPQPVQVRLLLLKERETLDGLDFRTVWQEGKKELKDALVRTIELTVFPGKDKVSTYEAPQGVGFVALIGLFRRPDDNEWKYVVDLRSQAKACREGSLHVPVQAEIRDNKIVHLEPE